jgi:hypothetical protein
MVAVLLRERDFVIQFVVCGVARRLGPRLPLRSLVALPARGGIRFIAAGFSFATSASSSAAAFFFRGVRFDASFGNAFVRVSEIVAS